MARKLFMIHLITSFFLLFHLYANEGHESVRLILEMEDISALPRNFRSYYDQKESKQLQISGSAQFSVKGLEAILSALEVLPENLIVVDLREESHGFINHAAVSWYTGYQNWGNVGLSLESILTQEQLGLWEALEAEWIWIFASKSALLPVPRKVFHVATEGELLASKGIHYIRLPITDHTKPSDLVVDQFLQLLRQTPENYQIHFHCKAGKGRTSTLLVMSDIYFNAHRLPLESILSNQADLGGRDIRADTDKEWKEPLFKERLLFVEKFYHYRRENPKLEKSWQEWSLSH